MSFSLLLRKLTDALVVAAMLLVLVACGVASTGGAPITSSPQPTASAVSTTPPSPAATTAAPLPTRVEAVAEPTSGGTAVASQAGSVKDHESLIDALGKAGAKVTVGDTIEQPFLSVTGTQLSVNGADVQVFEYADEAAAQADATKLANVLAGREATMITWVGSPHAYHAGRVLALYVGDDQSTLKLLQGVLGEPIAEQQLPAHQQSTVSPTAATTASPGSGQVSDLASLVDRLRADGLDVQSAGEVEQPFFHVAGTVLKINRADVQVFEFADAAEAKAAVATIGANGDPPTIIVEWVAPPHFYQSGRIVVLYVGEDKAITAALTKTLGPQVAGR
jgi:hypothetical protein